MELSVASVSDASVEDRTMHRANGAAAAATVQSPVPSTKPRSMHMQNTVNKTPTGTPMATPAPTPVLTKSMRTDMPDIPTLTLDTSAATTPAKGSWQEEPPESPQSKLKRGTSYKDRQLDSALFADVVNMTDLKSLCWNGIPPEHRAQAWKLMLGYLPTNTARRDQTLARKRAEYKDAIAQHYDIDDDVRTTQEQETLRQVLVDVPRTAPDVGLFRNDRIRKALSRLLFVWAMRHPASSYVQGINDLATPLIIVFLGDYYPDCDNVLDGDIMEQVSDKVMEEIEADCYWCLTKILAGIQDHYTSDQPGVQRMVMRLEELVTRIDADLTQYLKDVGIEFMQFSFKWMNCLLLREFNPKCVHRLWDTYISEGDGGFSDFHVYVCAAFLCQFSSHLQSMGFDELFGFMQRMPTDEWGDTEIEILLSQAFVLSTLFGGSDAHLAGSRRKKEDA